MKTCSCCKRDLGLGVQTLHDGREVCADCYAAYYHRCGTCQEIFPLHMMVFHTDGDFCTSCFTERRTEHGD